LRLNKILKNIVAWHWTQNNNHLYIIIINYLFTIKFKDNIRKIWNHYPYYITYFKQTSNFKTTLIISPHIPINVQEFWWKWLHQHHIGISLVKGRSSRQILEWESPWLMMIFFFFLPTASFKHIIINWS
jgi:hypothetical protein